MLNNIVQYITLFFTSKDKFKEDEWVLKYQIQSMLIFSFFFGIGIFFFSIFRFLEHNYIVALSQFMFSLFSIYGFFHLRKNKNLYQPYSIIFFILFFTYTGIIFFLVPQNSLNILWVISAPILIFFFLNKRGGITMFLLIFMFILYLIFSKYHYTIAEFITLFAAFFITTFMMYMYEKVKEKEKIRLLNYNIRLEKEVQTQTQKLKELNTTLTLRVEKEVAKQKAQEQMLLCQNRMANMGMMIDSIAHQWRQPLMHINSILMNISRVTETQPNNSNYIDNKVDNIFNITEHMSQTIGDFRDLFSPEKEKSKFNVKQLIYNILTLMKNNLKEIKIKIEATNNLEVNSYQNELSQVLIIVLQNALEALKEKEILKKEILIKIYENKERLFIELNDTANGISNEHIQHIFEPYFTTKKSSSGTGLGLHIAKVIMERSLQGDITVSNKKFGASFQITLPK